MGLILLMPYIDLQFPWGVATMRLFINSNNCQMVAFTVTTLGWIFTMISMGLMEWRVWYMDNSTSSFPTGLACIGLWKVCTHHQVTYSRSNTACHLHPYRDTYLPLDIRVAQHLLLAASTLGLLGKVLLGCALRNVCFGQLQKNATWNLFLASGILNITAGAFISVAVIWNYHSVMNEEGIDFPPSFYIPFKPDKQEIGSAIPVAVLAACMMLFGGLFSFSYKFPAGRQVHPEVSEI
ncbi:claudin-34-like [Molossus nigricans]